jgi:hypothetical protein
LRKNNKKAFLSLTADMLGWIIFFIGMIVWFLIFTVTQSTIKYDITSQGAYVEDKAILINILQSPVAENTNVADEIIISILQNKQTKAKDEIDKILNSIYGRADKVCWALWYKENNIEKTLFDVECTKKKQVLFNQETKIPSPQKPIDIRLAVLGYRE